MNHVTLIGRLGKDVELRYTENQLAVANFTLATSEYSKDKDKENTTWHNIVVWEKRAEVCAKHLAKGSQVAIQGRIQNRTYTDKEGVKRYTTEIVAQNVEFLGSKQQSEGKQFEPSGDTKVSQEPAKSFNDDDIPF